MTLYRYKAIQGSGEMVEGATEAPDRETVVARLRAGGGYPIEIEAAGAEATSSVGGGASVQGSGSTRLRLSLKDQALLTRELGTLLGAGLAIDRALLALADLTSSGRVAAISRRLARDIQSGRSLSAACAALPRAFSRNYVTMVAAGEASGDLAAALERLALLIDRSRAVASAVGSALLYPAIVALVGVASAIFLVSYVLPSFADLLTGMGRELPWPTRMLLGLSEFLQRYGLWLALGVAGLGVLVSWRWRDPAFRLGLDRLLLRLPVLGGILRRVEIERTARVLAHLLAAGIDLPKALLGAREVAQNRAVAGGLGASEEAVRRGERLAAGLAAAGVFPPLLVELARVGEETGNLSDALLKVAEIQAREVERALARLVALIAPVTTILLGMMVAFLILAMFNTVLEIYDLGP